jgi:hypothetical protein
MATQGAGAKDQFSQAQSLAAQQQQAAVQAAAARAEAIGAPSAFNDQLQGQVTAAYGDAGLSLAARHQANQKEGAAVQGATGDYMSQLRAAMPVIQSKQNIAVQQILADAADKKAQRDYQQKDLAYNNKRLDAEIAKLNGTAGSAGLTDAEVSRYTSPLKSDAAASFLGVSPAIVRARQESPDYSTGRAALAEAQKSGMSLDEVAGLLKSTTSEAVGADGVLTTQPLDPEVVKLLLATYAPTFRTAQDVTDSKNRDLARKKAEHEAVSGTGTPTPAPAPEENAATRLVAEGVAAEKVKKEAAAAAAAALTKAEGQSQRQAEIKRLIRAAKLENARKKAEAKGTASSDISIAQEAGRKRAGKSK